MIDLLDAAVGPGRLRVVASDRTDGDVHPLRVAAPLLAMRHTAVAGRPWAMARQVHGNAVWHVGAGSRAAGEVIADVVVLEPTRRDLAVGIWTADCASLLLATDSGRLVGVHVGWRGLVAGAIQTSIAEAVAGGQSIVAVAAGPMIGPCCYEFGDADLAAVARASQLPIASIAGRSSKGTVSLDVRAVTDHLLSRYGLAVDANVDSCTACDDRWWSHRAGVDPQRQALVGWWA